MIVDESMQSLLNYGSPDFPFAFYRDESERLAESSISWHWHNSFEFSYAFRGSLTCEIGGETILLTQGDALFINSGILHCFTLRESSVLENILFEPEFVAPKNSRVYLTCVLPYLYSGRQYRVFREENEEDRRLISRLRDCCDAARGDKSGPDYPVGILSNVLAVWNEFVRDCEPNVKEESGHIVSLTQSRVRKMLYYIYTHYQEKIGLQEIAESAGISSREALRCFSESVRASPVHFLNMHRLKCAEQQLSSSFKPVSDIALETGFDNAGYFCKAFKKVYGTSPLQYRKNMMSAPADT